MLGHRDLHTQLADIWCRCWVQSKGFGASGGRDFNASHGGIAKISAMNFSAIVLPEREEETLINFVNIYSADRYSIC